MLVGEFDIMDYTNYDIDDECDEVDSEEEDEAVAPVATEGAEEEDYEAIESSLEEATDQIKELLAKLEKTAPRRSRARARLTPGKLSVAR